MNNNPHFIEATVIISNRRCQSPEVNKIGMKEFLDRILEQQKLNIDAGSGATFTKKAAQKAIEDALIKYKGDSK